MPPAENHPDFQPESVSKVRRIGILAGVLGCLLLFCAFRPATMQAAWEEIARIIELRSDPLPASPPRLSEHILEELAGMEAQKQAEVLMQRSVNHYEGAVEQVAIRVEQWRGQLTLSPQFSALLMTAINSNDLRVRAAALEVYLAAYDLPKVSASAFQLQQRIQDDPGARGWALWMLGALGNRGVEPEHAFDTLHTYLSDGDEETRFWAVEGMALLGSDSTIQPLLEVFHNDAAMRVRERAACSLAQSGMLRKDQRMRAVPELLNFMDDASLDPTTRTWVFQALSDITDQHFGADPAAWRNWWNSRRR